MFKNFFSHVDSILARDPAARSRLEIILLYPGLHALWFHALAHRAWRHDLYFLARAISQASRLLTNIEIHPGARIGKNLFIDHGTGVVIGETAVIGDNVMLYHDVTLGGTSLQKGMKRHPTLENNVIVGVGAQILGPVTVGDGARIGANAVVLKNVPQGAAMVGVPASIVGEARATQAFLAYGTPCDQAGPVEQELCEVKAELARLAERLQRLEDAAQDRQVNHAPRLSRS